MLLTSGLWALGTLQMFKILKTQFLLMSVLSGYGVSVSSQQ